MVFSTIVDNGSNNTFEFVADEEYDLTWGLTEYEEGNYPDGIGWLATGGFNGMVVKVSGEAVSNKNTDNTSADKQIWDKLIKVARNNDNPGDLDEEPQTLTLVLQTGNLVLTGWMVAFNAARRAPDGIAAIPLTIEFKVQTEDASDLS